MYNNNYALIGILDKKVKNIDKISLEVPTANAIAPTCVVITSEEGGVEGEVTAARKRKVGELD
jgi:hypothetical protein